MNKSKHPTTRNSAKRKILEYLSSRSADRYVCAKRLMPLFNVRSFRNVYSILERMTRWELVSRRTGHLGLAEWQMTAKGRERLNYYIEQGVGVML